MTDKKSPEPWTLESSERVHDYGIYVVRRDRARSPRTGTLHDYHIVNAPDGVTVLAITEGDELVLVEQYRHGTRQISLETPSGLMDEGEDPVESARRELREETGYEGDDARVIGTLSVNPSWETTRAHVVLMRGVRPAAETDPDPGEDLRVRVVPRDQVWGRVRDGEIDSSTVVAALHLLRLHQEQGGERSDRS